MPELKLKVKVGDKLEAYKIVSRVSFLAEILEAEFENQKYKFSKKEKKKTPKFFGRNDWGKES